MNIYKKVEGLVVLATRRARRVVMANFDWVAGPYRVLETLAFGGALQRARVRFLGKARGARRILIVGEGNGRHLAALREVNATAEVVVVDVSAGMLARARGVDGSGRTRFVWGDVRSMELGSLGGGDGALEARCGAQRLRPRAQGRDAPATAGNGAGEVAGGGDVGLEMRGEEFRYAPGVQGQDAPATGVENTGDGPERFDLVATHFVLDCFSQEDVELVVRRLAGAAGARAVWLVADFDLPKRGWGRVHAGVWLWVMYLFFRVVAGLEVRRLPGHEGVMEEMGFRRVGDAKWRWGLIRSECWERG